MHMQIRFVNLTPHIVNIVGEGEPLSLPPSGAVARCTTASVAAGVHGGVTLQRTTYGEVVGLPQPAEGVMYVVSALVRSAAPHRTDVASPGELVRDAAGQPTGCRGLVVN